jgi:hypothetical protein
MGGVFFAFSSFVMPALGRIPVAEGIRAMQRINVDVYHWTFMSTFFLTPIACVGIAAYAKERDPAFKVVPQNAPELHTWPGYLDVIDGLGMLVNQGVIGIRYWTGMNVDPAVMRSKLEEIFG